MGRDRDPERLQPHRYGRRKPAAERSRNSRLRQSLDFAHMKAQPADPGPRARRRASSRHAGREDILDAAEEVFAEYGYHEAALREIATRAQYSVGALYRFFSGKDELYQECFHRRGREFLAGMESVLSDKSENALTALVRLGDFQVEFFRTHPNFAHLVSGASAIASATVGEPKGDREIQENFQVALKMQADLIKRGQQRGEIRDGSPVVLARMFSGLIGAQQGAELADRRLRRELVTLRAILESTFSPVES